MTEVIRELRVKCCFVYGGGTVRELEIEVEVKLNIKVFILVNVV